MPGYTGFGLIRWVRTQLAYKELPIIVPCDHSVSTAKATHEDKHSQTMQNIRLNTGIGMLACRYTAFKVMV